mgnify:CR=1 FL=1
MATIYVCCRLCTQYTIHSSVVLWSWCRLQAHVGFKLMWPSTQLFMHYAKHCSMTLGLVICPWPCSQCEPRPCSQCEGCSCAVYTGAVYRTVSELVSLVLSQDCDKFCQAITQYLVSHLQSLLLVSQCKLNHSYFADFAVAASNFAYSNRFQSNILLFTA